VFAGSALIGSSSRCRPLRESGAGEPAILASYGTRLHERREGVGQTLLAQDDGLLLGIEQQQRKESAVEWKTSKVGFFSSGAPRLENGLGLAIRVNAAVGGKHGGANIVSVRGGPCLNGDSNKMLFVLDQTIASGYIRCSHDAFLTVCVGVRTHRMHHVACRPRIYG
jgi:hypothetical protein